MKTQVSVIITTKNEEKVLPDLLVSIEKQSYKNYEVLVIDNHSKDKTFELATKHGANIFIKGPERSTQRNFGASKAKGKYLVFLDADMQLTKDVLRDAVRKFESNKLGALIVPEKSFGVGYWAKVKAYERSFYVGDPTIEAARFFDKEVFKRFGGYDILITGPEDYDLPYRMKKNGVRIGRIKSYILHNEKKFSPIGSAKKKFYYASKAGVYLRKHPELAVTQGNMIFRPVFFKKWKKLVNNPTLSIGMFILKSLEMLGGVLGFAVGLIKER